MSDKFVTVQNPRQSDGLKHSKILIASDLHIHPHKKSLERLNHCLDVLDWIFSTASQHDINDVVFVGDLFHDRQKIDVITYHKTFEIFKKWSDINVHLLLGNHDLWHMHKWDISSIFPLTAMTNVHIIDAPKTIQVAGHPMSFLPYTSDPAKDLKAIPPAKGYRLLFAHVAIDGAIWNKKYGTVAEVSIEHDGDMQKVTADIFKGWDQVFLGHYHAEQQLNDHVEYVGSPLQLSFGEAFQQKHIIILDLDTHKKEYIVNDFSPKHFIVKAKDLDKYPIENNFFRVEVDDLTSSDVVDMKMGLIAQKAGSLQISQAVKKDEHVVIQDAKAILFKEDEMLDQYLAEVEKQDGLDGLDKEKLMTFGKLCFIPLEG